MSVYGNAQPVSTVRFQRFLAEILAEIFSSTVLFDYCFSYGVDSGTGFTFVLTATWRWPMSRTYGRMGGECWAEAYQKAEEIGILRRYKDNNLFSLTRVRQYFIVVVFSWAKRLYKSLSNWAKEKPQDVVIVTLGLTGVGALAAVAIIPITVFGITLPKILVPKILFHPISIILFTLTIERLIHFPFKYHLKGKLGSVSRDVLEKQAQKYKVRKETLELVGKIQTIIKKHNIVIESIKENEDNDYNTIIKNTQEIQLISVNLYKERHLNRAIECRKYLLYFVENTIQLIPEESYKTPSNIEDLGKVAHDLQELVLRS